MLSMLNAKTVTLLMAVSLVSAGVGSLITVKIYTPAIDFEEGIPAVDNPENPVVNGKSITPREFSSQYCDNQRAEFSMTCIAVRKAIKNNWNPLGGIPNAWKK